MKLKRNIGLFEATFYGVGLILGAGIYALIGPAAGMAGNSLWLSFVIGAIIASFTGLSYAELSTMFPKAAAEYIYVRRAFGSRFFAFLIGWLLVFTGMISAATVALGFSGYFKGLFGFPIIPTSLLLIALLSYINFRGIKESSRFNIFFTLVEIFGLLFIIVLGFSSISSISKINYFEMPFGWQGIFSAVALVFFAYIGFEDIVNVAEETRNPRKVLPRALILAIGITTLLYVFTGIVAVSLADWKELGTSTAPLALAASKVLGQKAFLFLSFVALFATVNTVLIILVVTSRMMYGMAREKSLPEFLSLVHERRRTPWLAVLIAMVFSMMFVFFGNIKTVAHLTSLAMFVTFVTINLSLIWLRYTMPRVKRAFRVPLNIGRFPLLALLGVLSSGFMIFQFDLNLILFGLGILIAGAVAYFIFMRKISG